MYNMREKFYVPNNSHHPQHQTERPQVFRKLHQIHRYSRGNDFENGSSYKSDVYDNKGLDDEKAEDIDKD